GGEPAFLICRYPRVNFDHLLDRDVSSQGIGSPTHPTHASGTGAVFATGKPTCGGPRLPNTSMVIRLPTLQHRHFLNRATMGLLSAGRTCRLSCNDPSLPRFQLLLNIP